jgi:hypothetical protein
VRKSRAIPKTAAREFSWNFITQALSFAAAMRGEKSTTPTLQEAAEGPKNSPLVATKRQHEPGPSIPANNVNSLPLDNMFRAVSAVQQIMTELSGAACEESKILAITKIVFNLMKRKW